MVNEINKKMICLIACESRLLLLEIAIHNIEKLIMANGISTQILLVLNKRSNFSNKLYYWSGMCCGIKQDNFAIFGRVNIEICFSIKEHVRSAFNCITQLFRINLSILLFLFYLVFRDKQPVTKFRLYELAKLIQ